MFLFWLLFEYKVSKTFSKYYFNNNNVQNHLLVSRMELHVDFKICLVLYFTCVICKAITRRILKGFRINLSEMCHFGIKIILTIKQLKPSRFWKRSFSLSQLPKFTLGRRYVPGIEPLPEILFYSRNIITGQTFVFQTSPLTFLQMAFLPFVSPELCSFPWLIRLYKLLSPGCPLVPIFLWSLPMYKIKFDFSPFNLSRSNLILRPTKII